MDRLEESKEDVEKRKAKEEREGELKKRKQEEAIDLVATCLDSFAFYYYVQRRALANQEVQIVETAFCTSFE